jgi:predicted tellurium resistance membrane protein TerC
LALRHFTAEEDSGGPRHHTRDGAGFWATVVNVEIADIAFSIDSILAAVAMADGLPKSIAETSVITIAGVGTLSLKVVIVYVGGVLGIIAMRLVAGVFLVLLEKFKGLAEGAYVLVAWIGLELVGSGLHSWKSSLPLEMPWWVFWIGMGLIVFASMIYRPRGRSASESSDALSLEDPVSHDGSPVLRDRD